ncbi:MAG: ATP-dependent DNA helicase DinG, partial [Burkholderiales bacterium]
TAELLLTEGEDARRYAKWISVNAGPNHVGVQLHACPILPGELLNRELWPKVRAAAITSATLTSCGDFGYFLREAGLERDPAVTTISVASPFDYAQQGELVIQKTLAAPRALDDYNAEVSRLIIQAIPSSRAGALVLFTSRRHLEATVELLSDELKERVLVQGMVGRSALLERHKARVNSGLPSIILGLQGFGEGRDLPGALLEDLYIAKLPFASPSGPLDEARAEYVEAEGGDAFNDLVVPATGLRLLQWVGRGVRTETDFARIVCFDSRLTDRAFGRKMLSGLPPYPIRQIAVRRETADLI